jgi:hypothetical protein
MPNRESFISQWRQTLSNAPHLTPETLDELESHLREQIEKLVQSGVPEAEACKRAVAELGSSATIANEFRKLDAATWLPVKFVSGIGIALVLVLAIFLVGRPNAGADVLLAVHIFTVTLGYAAALLLGVLGACFVVQRARSDFSPLRLASLGRVTFVFAAVSTICTAIGVILAMFWAHREWGRYWDWDSKEIGGLCVVVWMSGFLLAHSVRWVSTRGLLVASLLGSNVVSLAWFAPGLPAGLHAHGLPSVAWLLLPAAIVLNLSLIVLGLAPSGCLRARRT